MCDNIPTKDILFYDFMTHSNEMNLIIFHGFLQGMW